MSATTYTDRAQWREDLEQHAREQNERRIAAELAYFSERPEESASRLAEIEREWSAERALDAVASKLGLLGLGLGLLGKRRWLLLPLIAQAMSLQQALQGKSIALDAVRRLGLRTNDEIARERAALLALRDRDSHDAQD